MSKVIEVNIKIERADETFEKLGYRKIEDEKRIYYTTNKGIGCGSRGIEFRIKQQKVVPYNRVQIDMKTLRAINKKCKELGWI